MSKRRVRSILTMLLAVALCFQIQATDASAAKSKAKKSGAGAVKSVKVVSPAGSKKKMYVARGKTVKPAVDVKAKGKKANRKVTYRIANKKIASVTKKGAVKGRKIGKTKLTVTSVKNPKKKKVIRVQVVNPVKKVKLDQTKATLSVTASMTLKAGVTAPKKSFKKLKWTSSNRNVASVSGNGVVKGLKEGTAKITAASLDGTKKKSVCTVTVANGIKELSVLNPANSYYSDKLRVTLYLPKVLTKNDFRVRIKTTDSGQYVRSYKIDNIFTTDNINYDIFLKDSEVSVGDYVEVTIGALGGVKTMEKCFMTDGDDYEDIVRANVGDLVDEYIGSSGSIGTSSKSIESGTLPAGLYYDNNASSVRGIAGAVANNQKVTFAVTDEKGQKKKTNVNFLIGDKNHIVVESKTIGDKESERIYTHQYIDEVLYATGGSGEYNYMFLDDAGGVFNMYSERGTGSPEIYTDSDKIVREGTYTARIRVSDANNTSLYADGTLTCVITATQQVNVVMNYYYLHDYENSGGVLYFYNHELDERFSYDVLSKYDRTLNTCTYQYYLPNGHYSVYFERCGNRVVLDNYRTITGTTWLRYNMPSRADLRVTLKDKNGALLNRSVDLRLYKPDEPYDSVYSLDTYGDSEETFYNLLSGTYIVEAYYEGERVRSGTVTVGSSQVSVTLQFKNLENYSYNDYYDEY